MRGFSGFGFSAITINGNPTTTRGVIFNNDFTNNYFYNSRSQTIVLGYGVVVYGDGSWPELRLGTADNIFIENNYMYGNRHHVASNNSSRYVYRYNTAITTTNTRNHYALDAHGRGANNGSKSGSRQYEIYGNVIDTDLPKAESARTAIGIRGGDGVIFANFIGAQFRFGLELMVENAREAQGKEACNSVPDRITDLYIWDNRISVANSAKNGVLSVCPNTVQLGRDYFLQSKKYYFPFTYPHPLR